jgi:4'-phosphopantetheinyl transferase
VKSTSIGQLATIRIIDLNTIPDTECAALLTNLSEAESLRYQRLARAERKKQFLIGRLLMRYSLAQLHGIGADQIVVTERERQAPLVQIATLTLEPCFSISHSAQWVACASSSSVHLGLDIELIDAKRNLEAISAHTFLAEDLTWLDQQPDRVAAFYALWSQKEARFKLTQGYAKAAIEHHYALPHPTLSVVVMSDQALDAAPEMQTLSWDNLREFFA